MTVPTLNVGACGVLSHQDFLDDFIGSLSKLQRDADSRLRAALAATEAACGARLAEAEARWAGALAEERAEAARLRDELDAARAGEQKLALSLACVATELGLEDAVAELGADEAAVQAWCEERRATEQREAAKKKARTKAAMEAAAREREQAQAEAEASARGITREQVEMERKESTLEALVASLGRIPLKPAVRPERWHLDATLCLLVKWSPELKAHFARRHATVAQVLLAAQAKGIDWPRAPWDVTYVLNPADTGPTAGIRTALPLVRDCALLYLREHPEDIHKTAELEWRTISRALRGSREETFDELQFWVRRAHMHVERATWSL